MKKRRTMKQMLSILTAIALLTANLINGSSNPVIAFAEGTTPQTITFDTLPDKTYGDVSFQLTATASSNLDVSYTSSNTDVATVSGSAITIMGAGATTITVSQSGDETYSEASPVEQVLTVNKAAGPALADGATAYDRTNTVEGMTHNMEFSTDGDTWTVYNETTPNLPDLTGTVALQVRYAESENYLAGEATTFEFTADAIDAIEPSGAGTAGNPYQIDTAANLIWMSDQVMADNNYFYGMYFIQTVDIDMSSAINFKPIGAFIDNMSDGRSFEGLYDGNNHKIFNLTMNDNDSSYLSYGLFGLIGAYGTIQNVVLDDAKITAGASANKDVHLGLLAAYNRGAVKYCRITKTGADTSYLKKLVSGGYIGAFSSLITETAVVEKCVNEADISAIGNVYIGGIAGENFGVAAENMNKGKVTAYGSYSNVGGIIGDQDNNGKAYDNLNIGYTNGGGIIGLVNYSDVIIDRNYYLEDPQSMVFPPTQEIAILQTTMAVLRNQTPI